MPRLQEKLHFCTWNWPFAKKKKRFNLRKKSDKFSVNGNFWLKMTNVTEDKTSIFLAFFPWIHSVSKSEKNLTLWRVQCETKFLSWVLMLQKSLVLKMLSNVGLFSRGQMKRSRLAMSHEINYLTIIFPPKSQNNMEKCLYVICSLLNPTVGKVSMLSLDRRNLYKMVVFPDASKPKSTILAGLRFTHCEIVVPIFTRKKYVANWWW